MNLPHDIDASKLIKVLRKFGYEATRQTGSHIRLTTQQNGQHHLTIPNHDPIKIRNPKCHTYRGGTAFRCFQTRTY